MNVATGDLTNDAAEQALEAAERNFIEHGHGTIPGFFSPADCRRLLSTAKATRDLDALFLTEQEFDANPVFTRANPRPGRNLAEKLDTDFIFGDQAFVDLLTRLVGPRFRVLDYKFVMGLPASLLPDWLKPRIEDRLVNNLGPYIRPEYRDMTYFHGIDYHQDIIDFPDRRGDFVTAYLYLDDVRKDSAPLHLLSDSHRFGATEFPHALEHREGARYAYSDHTGRRMECEELLLTGGPGDLSFWHSTILHGTQPQADDETRISLRLLIEKNQAQDTGSWLDRLNRTIDGNLALASTRRDVDASGKAALTGNTINRQGK
ncbi:MAG: phytanoyl-CoA dioxygenase family protein [Erythrobacter sp.]|jgi:hypothetical protein|nr:phytanoyl-CoA dioxygenase family protein [Erythrobacter sp.]